MFRIQKKLNSNMYFCVLDLHVNRKHRKLKPNKSHVLQNEVWERQNKRFVYGESCNLEIIFICHLQLCFRIPNGAHRKVYGRKVKRHQTHAHTKRHRINVHAGVILIKMSRIMVLYCFIFDCFYLPCRTSQIVCFAQTQIHWFSFIMTSDWNDEWRIKWENLRMRNHCASIRNTPNFIYPLCVWKHFIKHTTFFQLWHIISIHCIHWSLTQITDENSFSFALFVNIHITHMHIYIYWTKIYFHIYIYCFSLFFCSSKHTHTFILRNQSLRNTQIIFFISLINTTRELPNMHLYKLRNGIENKLHGIPMTYSFCGNQCIHITTTTKIMVCSVHFTYLCIWMLRFMCSDSECVTF